MVGGMTIRKLDESSLATMLDWAAGEGWNPGLDDATAFLTTDPEGFLGLFLDDELTATIAAVRYDARFGFVGFYICRPDRRGEGLGLRLFQAALAGLDATTIGLDGVLEQEPNYQRSGFVTAHRNVRFRGTPDVADAVDGGVRTLRGADIERLVAYEHAAAVFPAPRHGFLEAWLAARDTRGFCVSDGDDITGYGVIRRCRSGYKIGPLFSQNADDAQTLLAALVGAVDTDDISLDVPEPNAVAMQLARDAGLSPAFVTVRMYRGPDPGIALHRVFGVTSFELG
jgi:hypothetical protein